jgi:predicted dehydrogenase
LHYDQFHLEMQRLTTGGGLGTIKTLDGGFGYSLRNRDHRIVKALAGGGPLMDLGIYVVHASCMAMGSAPKFVTAREDPKTEPEWFKEVEEGISWRLEFENGAVADGMASFSKSANRFRVNGTKGFLDLTPAFSYRGIQGATDKGKMNFASVDQQALQMDDFARCVLNNTPSRVPGELGLRDIKILMAIYAAARTGKRIPIAA